MSTEHLAQPQLPPGSEENRAPTYKSFVIFMAVLVTTIVALRFWSRSLTSRQMSGRIIPRFWWDDWVALAAAVMIWIYFGFAFALVHLGFGLHLWMVPPPNLPMLFKFLYTVYYLYDVSLFLTKLSALLFLSRVFPMVANSKLWNYTLLATYGLNVAWLIGIITGTVFMCDPVQKGWNPMLPGKCGSTSALWTGSAIPSVFVDLVILLLPVPKIWYLRTSRTRKAGLLLVFVLGYSVIIVSLGRMITVLKSAEALNEDITYEGMPMVYWVTCEAPATLISICLPPMINLVKQANTSFFSPFSGKISSLWSTYTVGNSSFKSRDGTFATHTKGADQATKSRHRSASKSHADVDGSMVSMESRSGLVNNNLSDSQIPLSDLSAGQEQYMASIESKGRDRDGGYSVAPDYQIRVNRDICVDRHLPGL